MSRGRVQRRMAAILAADVVGYSRLMGKDEEGTLAKLKVYRQLIDAVIADHEGRIFGSAGDSVIAEFASPVEAVRCAVEVQLQIDKLNQGLPESGQMRFRIGLNLGDIIVDGKNLMGDGVNIAARLEALAPPGGIYISQSVHAQVCDRLSLAYLDIGDHRVKNIARPIHVYRIVLDTEKQAKSPFRGLDPFEFNHAEMFFGRGAAIASCIKRLEQLAEDGKAFLLIYGMSGSGKSSLLRAGLLPAITKAGTVPGIGLWRWCVMRPSEGQDALASFAAALLRETSLPELGEERTAADLASLFRASPDHGLALIRSVLAKVAVAAKLSARQARLVIGVDQMEEILTASASPSSQQAFVKILAALSNSGCAWVIATMRGDFFHRCSEIPGFAALKDGLGSYELLAPTRSEIAQIIREPARLAGLQFEEDGARGRLDDVLEEAAAADPGSLPLLQFVLEALYEGGRDRRLLSFATYRALGGLEGAIARRADDVIDALPPDIQETLPAALRALTTIRLGDEVTTVRPAPFADVANTPEKSALVDAMIGARLLVSDDNTEGHAVIRPAHEALLSRWPRAREIVNANRKFLETRARIQSDARRWISDGKNPELLLPSGVRLAEGEELLQTRGEELEDQVRAYITASIAAEQARLEKERQAERARVEAAEAASRARLSLEAAAGKRLAQRTRYAALVASVLALAAGTGAFLGWRGQLEARRQTAAAEASANLARVAESQARAAEQKALQARDDALRNQSLTLSSSSQQSAMEGDTETAILLALEALPQDVVSPERPLVVEAEATLYQALLQDRSVMVLRHDASVADAEFNRSGDRIVTASFDATARIWAVGDGKQVAVLKGHQGALEKATFSPDGKNVLTAARDSTARLWDATSGQQLFALPIPGEFPTAVFSPNGARILTGSVDQRVDQPTTIWDAKSGKKAATVLQPPIQGYAAFSPDGAYFTAGLNSWTVGIWNAEEGTPVKNITTTASWADDVAFSPDGTRILVSTWGTFTFAPHTSLLLDARKGTEIAALGGHRSDTRTGTFSHSGRLVATVSIDGTARLWDGVTGKFITSLGAETPGLAYTDAKVPLIDQDTNAVFSPDDRVLATASLDGAIHIWDVESGLPSLVIRGHKGLVEHLAFSPEGELLLTASHDGTARLWDVDGILTTTLHHEKPPTFAAFSPDGQRVVTGGQSRVAHVWDVSNGREIAQLVSQQGGQFQAAAFNNDSHSIAAGTRGGTITIWDTATGQQIRLLKGHTAGVTDLRFSPHGDVLLSTSVDGTARLWDASTGTQVAVLQSDGRLWKSVFSPDGRFVLTSIKDNTAQIWASDGRKLANLAGHKGQITAAAFSSDNRFVVTASVDGTARTWSLPDGKPLIMLKGHAGPVTDVSVNGDGKLVVTAGRDKTARIWRVADGVQLTTLEGHDAALSSAAFSPNGLYVITTSAGDHSVRLWDVASGREIATLADKQRSAKPDPMPANAVFNKDGTQVLLFSGGQDARIVRVFPSLRDLVEYAHAAVPRELSVCERRRFFLPVEGDIGSCEK